MASKHDPPSLSSSSSPPEIPAFTDPPPSPLTPEQQSPPVLISAPPSLNLRGFDPSVGNPKINASPSASPMGMAAPPSSFRLGGDLPATSSSTTALAADTGVPRPLEALQAAAVPIPPFLSKTYDLVDDASLDPVLSWAPSGHSFVVWDPVHFSTAILPRHFKHNNFSSFVRQLNTYGFHKVDADRWEFSNEDFLRGHKHLLRNIHRRRSSQVQPIGSYPGSSLELARSGLEGEVEKLRKDKNLLAQEVVKMQKEHLTMIQQMDTMKQRMQLAEERQKQTVSFLAKVLQNPAFLDHLRQWKEKGEAVSTRIKRKFLKQSKANQSEPASPCEGQIVKYKHTLDGVISSSMNRVMDTSAQELLEEDYFLGGMEDKLGLDENSREFFGTSDETGVRIPAFVDSSDALFKGKYVMSSPMDTSVAAPDFFVTLPEDVSQEEIFLDSMSSETERITLQEGTWNVDFSAVASLLNPGSDIWNDLLGKDAQELDNEAGSSTSWNIGLQEGGEFEIDKLVGDESSYGGCQDQAGLEDSQKNMNS